LGRLVVLGTAAGKHEGVDMSATIRFGLGNYGVDIGTLGDEPCVFIIPKDKPGPVGELIPLSEQGPLELERLPDDWTVLLFPTRDRCKEVADALVGSKMAQWSDEVI
jgi:hypothetical protein